MTSRLLLLGAALAVLVALPAAASGAQAHADSGSKTYRDAPSPDPQAPDITSMVVSNDNARTLTFKLNIANRPKLTPDMLILCWFDTDENTSTGDSKASEGIPGGDYVIQLAPGEVDLFRWNGSDYISGSSQSTLGYTYSSSGATIHINASELGATKAFRFACAAVSGIATDASGNQDFTNDHQDLIPQNGTLQYTVEAKLQLAETGFATGPAPAKAGAPFAVSLGASENDTNGPVAGATVTCAAQLGTKPISSTHTLANGVASCYWRLPKAAKGKTLRGKVTVTVHGVSLTKSFAVRVR